MNDLKAGWAPHLEAIDRVRKKHGKPVVFTEIGYRSTTDAAIEPWQWPQRGPSPLVDLETQSSCYRAFFELFWDQPWFAGAYLWKWFPRHERAGGEKHHGFTPQNKPAEKIVEEWYGRGK